MEEAKRAAEEGSLNSASSISRSLPNKRLDGVAGRSGSSLTGWFTQGEVANSTEFSAEGGSRRAAAGAGLDLAGAYGGVSQVGCAALTAFLWLVSSGCYQSVRRCKSCKGRAGTEGAMAGCCDDLGSRFDAGHPSNQRIGHGAVVCAKTAAACGQTRIVAGFKGSRERAKSEKQHQEDG